MTQSTTMNKNYKKGIAIFIAVITVSALMLIALAISDISYKEQIISSSGRDSRIAFFAASSGIECALFHDLKGGGSDGLFKFAVPGADQIGDVFCNNDDDISPLVTDVDESEDSNTVTTTFYFNLPASPKSCAIVKVSKIDASGGGINTVIESSGYNNVCEETSTPGIPALEDGPRNLERSFRATY